MVGGEAEGRERDARTDKGIIYLNKTWNCSARGPRCSKLTCMGTNLARELGNSKQ